MTQRSSKVSLSARVGTAVAVLPTAWALAAPVALIVEGQNVPGAPGFTVGQINPNVGTSTSSDNAATNAVGGYAIPISAVNTADSTTVYRIWGSVNGATSGFLFTPTAANLQDRFYGVIGLANDGTVSFASRYTNDTSGKQRIFRGNDVLAEQGAAGPTGTGTYAVGLLYTTSGAEGTTYFRGPYASPTGAGIFRTTGGATPGVAPVIKTGDTIFGANTAGLTVAATGPDSSFAVARNGQDLLSSAKYTPTTGTGNGSGTPNPGTTLTYDSALLFDNTVRDFNRSPLQEGVVIPGSPYAGERWDEMSGVTAAINSKGQFIAAPNTDRIEKAFVNSRGTTTYATDNDEVLVVNNQIVGRENSRGLVEVLNNGVSYSPKRYDDTGPYVGDGTVLDGVTLTSFVRQVGINDNGDWAAIWSDTLFVNGKKVVAVGDNAAFGASGLLSLDGFRTNGTTNLQLSEPDPNGNINVLFFGYHGPIATATDGIFSVSVAVPEPSMLAGVGLAIVTLGRRRRRYEN